MGEVAGLRAVDVGADPHIRDMCDILSNALQAVRRGDVRAVGLFLVTPTAVQTLWAMETKRGHGHLLASGATRMLHDLNALSSPAWVPDMDDGEDA